MEIVKPHTERIEYQRKVFSMRQVRDCVAGSDAIKRSGELYVPMPSGMRYSQTPTATPAAGATNPLNDTSLSLSQAPWHHSNANYSAYLHRAKFPDLTNNTLRGLVGIATRELPQVELPGPLKYLEELATLSGETLDDLYEFCVSEVFQVGRVALVLDIREDNSFYIAQYSSESYINWRMEVVEGKRVQTYAEFQVCEIGDDGEEVQKSIAYSLEAEEDDGPRTCFVRHYIDGKQEGDALQLIYQGKPLLFIPVVNIGAENNTPEPDALPLLGVSDCSLDIYRHSADLNQAQFMTCNPTLVFTGVDQDDAPRTIGSTVAICLSDPESDAKYVSTDTSALGHVKDYILDIFQEAVLYGASLIGPSKKAVESAEALSLRQSASGATLVTVVARVGAGIQKILDMATELSGTTDAEFLPNYEFAETALSAQEVLALMNLWMNGGISRDTLLGNLAAAGRLMGNTPEEEAGAIDDEGIITTPEPVEPV